MFYFQEIQISDPSIAAISSIVRNHLQGPIQVYIDEICPGEMTFNNLSQATITADRVAHTTILNSKVSNFIHDQGKILFRKKIYFLVLKNTIF